MNNSMDIRLKEPWSQLIGITPPNSSIKKESGIAELISKLLSNNRQTAGRHSREGGNPCISRPQVDPRLRGDDGNERYS